MSHTLPDTNEHEPKNYNQDHDLDTGVNDDILEEVLKTTEASWKWTNIESDDINAYWHYRVYNPLDTADNSYFLQSFY